MGYTSVTVGPRDLTGPSTRYYAIAEVISQNVGTNQSLIRVRSVVYNGPSGNSSSFYGGSGGTSASIDSIGHSVYHGGTPFLPSGYAQNQLRWDDASDMWVSHDANGYLGPLAVRLGIAGPANEDHYGTLYVDRIPRTPIAAGAPVVSGLAPTSAVFTWTGSPDSRGSGIDQYLLRISTSNPADTPGTYTDYTVDGSTLTKTVTGLVPGTQYYAVVYAHNSVGYSLKSTQTPFKTFAGAYVWTGSTWSGSEVLVRNATNTAWVTGEVNVRNAGNTAWVLSQ